MREELKKGLLFAASLLSGLILLIATVIYVLARKGLLRGIGHL
jgi:hypothetical protein